MVFKFTGKDSSSDNGHFVVLIEAANKAQADIIMNAHLIQMGKGALCSCERIKGSILYTTVEAANVLSKAS